MANEKRLIDANALKGDFMFLRKMWSGTEISAVIDNAPTVDAVEVVHGEWEIAHGVLTPGGDPLLRCAICKSRESEHLCGVECHTVWNYCPNCGAKMDGGNEDD